MLLIYSPSWTNPNSNPVPRVLGCCSCELWPALTASSLFARSHGQWPCQLTLTLNSYCLLSLAARTCRSFLPFARASRLGIPTGTRYSNELGMGMIFLNLLGFEFWSGLVLGSRFGVGVCPNQPCCHP